MDQEQLQIHEHIIAGLSRTKSASLKRLYDCGVLNKDGSVREEYSFLISAK